MNKELSLLSSAAWSVALLLFYPVFGMFIVISNIKDMVACGDISSWHWDLFFAGVKLQWLTVFCHSPLFIFVPVVIFAAWAFGSRAVYMYLLASVVTVFCPPLIWTGLYMLR